MKTQTPDKGTELLEDALRPLITWTSIQGNKAKIVKAFQAYKPTVTRQTIETWIATNEATRRVPMMDNGLLLLHCAKELKISADLPK